MHYTLFAAALEVISAARRMSKNSLSFRCASPCKDASVPGRRVLYCGADHGQAERRAKQAGARRQWHRSHKSRQIRNLSALNQQSAKRLRFWILGRNIAA